MTNLFPLPYWAPALQRVPKPLQRLDEAFALGERACQGADGWRPLTVLSSFRRKPQSSGTERN